MNCQGNFEDLSAYADGELQASEIEAVEVHLKGCDECRRILEEYRALYALLDADADTDAAPGFLEGVRDRVFGAGVASPGRGRILRTVAAIAASVLLLLGLIFLGNRELGEDEKDRGSSTSSVDPGEAFEEVEWAVQGDPELLEILDNLEALERIELLENLPILERMEDYEGGEADDLARAAEVLILEEEVPIDSGE
jgi:hypothetical protein